MSPWYTVPVYLMRGDRYKKKMYVDIRLNYGRAEPRWPSNNFYIIHLFVVLFPVKEVTRALTLFGVLPVPGRLLNLLLSELKLSQSTYASLIGSRVPNPRLISITCIISRARYNPITPIARE